MYQLKGGEVKKVVESEKTGSNKGRLVPTDMGKLVSDFLSEHFDNIMNYNFTADIEKKFDTIAEGGIEWNKMLKDFYGPFHEVVVDTIENADRASGERILGKDPASGRTVLVRMSRYGAVAQIGAPDELEEDEKPKYANLRRGMALESVTYEDVIDLFKLPLTLGSYEDHDVIIKSGPYGPYVAWGEAKISLPRGQDPLTVDMDQATVLIEEKKEADRPLGTYKGVPYTRGKGRFGPFLKYGDLFINIPRRYEPENLTTEEAHELIEAKLVKEANRYIHNWEDEKISVENARWGPLIRFKKKKINLKNEEGKRITPEEAKEYTLEQVKAIIEEHIPDAFKKKTRKKAATKKKPAAKKKTTAKKKKEETT